MISAGTSLGIYATITLLYFVFKYLLVENFKIINQNGYPHGLNSLLSLVYYVLMIFAQYYVNVMNTYKKCGESQVWHAAIYTFVPNILIFGLLVVILDVFPGFLKPFSNTIGFGLVWLFGDIRNVFNKMLISKNKSRFIQQVYDDNSMMVNEMSAGSKGNIVEFIKKAAAPGPDRLFNNKYKEHLPKLFNLVVIKDLISKYIWYMLVGSLVVSTSFNSINNMRCKLSPDAIKRRQEKEEETDKETAKELNRAKGTATKVFI
jgi:hypothetical protein